MGFSYSLRPAQAARAYRCVRPTNVSSVFLALRSVTEALLGSCGEFLHRLTLHSLVEQTVFVHTDVSQGVTVDLAESTRSGQFMKAELAHRHIILVGTVGILNNIKQEIKVQQLHPSVEVSAALFSFTASLLFDCCFLLTIAGPAYRGISSLFGLCLCDCGGFRWVGFCEGWSRI